MLSKTHCCSNFIEIMKAFFHIASLFKRLSFRLLSLSLSSSFLQKKSHTLQVSTKKTLAVLAAWEKTKKTQIKKNPQNMFLYSVIFRQNGNTLHI